MSESIKISQETTCQFCQHWDRRKLELDKNQYRKNQDVGICGRIELIHQRGEGELNLDDSEGMPKAIMAMISGQPTDRASFMTTGSFGCVLHQYKPDLFSVAGFIVE